MNIRLINLRRDKAHLEDVERLYNSAFPDDERAPFGRLMRGAKKKNVNFFSCMDGEEWIGLLYVVNYLDMSYIFYFAVDDKKRGRGYGTAILRAARKKYAGRRLFLAIEEIDENYENYAERLKRRDFYQRAGFELTGQKMQEASVIYDLMGIGGSVDNKGYRRLMRTFFGGRIFFITLKIFEGQQGEGNG